MIAYAPEVDHLTYLQAIVMGLLQGVAELFPISSLGHSLLLPAWLGGSWGSMVTQQSGSKTPFLAFIVALHVATALALIVFYRQDWVQVVGGAGDIVRQRGVKTARARLCALLVIGTIPVGIVGLVFDHPLRTLFAKPFAAAAFLTLNGFVLLIAERLTQRARRAEPVTVEDGHASVDAAEFDDITFKEALLIGASQILALFPGISRSGVTISTGLLRGLTHVRATHFAFLLATPVILAAGVLKLPELFGSEGKGIGGQVLAGSVVAFVAAYVAARWLTNFFRTSTLYPFVAYCLIVGIASMIRFA